MISYRTSNETNLDKQFLLLTFGEQTDHEFSRDADRSATESVKIKGPNVTEFTIKDLEV